MLSNKYVSDRKNVIKIFGISVGLKTVRNLWISWNKASLKKE